MNQATYLIQMLLTALGGRGLAPEALDPWRAWVAFKQYVRLVDETPDPGTSVQLTRNRRAGTVTLLLVRQAVTPVDNWLEPDGGVVVDFTIKQGGVKSALFPILKRTPSFVVTSVSSTVNVIRSLAQCSCISRLVTSAVAAKHHWGHARSAVLGEV